MSCRTPEIVKWWPEGYGPDNPYISEGEPYQHYRCINCDRWAYACPNCSEIRCDSWLYKAMIPGSFPLACKVCMPKGIHQEFLTGAGGTLGGGELHWREKT